MMRKERSNEMEQLRKFHRTVRKHHYSIKRKNKNSRSTFYHLSSGATIEKSSGRFKLLQNYTDGSNKYVIIEFYLPEPAAARLILIDSDFNDSMYLLNKELKPGKHILKTDIENVELLIHRYYYKLEAYGEADTKQMSYTYKPAAKQ